MAKFILIALIYAFTLLLAFECGKQSTMKTVERIVDNIAEGTKMFAERKKAEGKNNDTTTSNENNS